MAPNERATSSFARRRVDRDDRLGADRDGSHQRRQADTAAADDRDPVAGPHAGSAPDRTDAGRHGAADEAGDGERDVLGIGTHERSGTTHASANVERNE